MLPANVLRVDRNGQRAEVIGVGMRAPVMVTYPDKKRPPPLLGTILVDQVSGGGWVAREGPSVRERLLDEEFGTAGSIGTALQGDTLWSLNFAVAGIVTQSNLAGGSGVAYMQTSTTAADFCSMTKDDTGLTLESDLAYWLSAKLAPDQPALSDHAVGFSDNAGTVQAAISYASGSGFSLYLNAIAGGGNSTKALPYLPSAFVTYIMDVVLLPGVCIVGWVDGDGPYVLSTNVPAALSGIQPFAYVKTNTGASRGILIDWIHVEQFTNPVHPDRLYDLSLVY